MSSAVDPPNDMLLVDVTSPNSPGGIVSGIGVTALSPRGSGSVSGRGGVASTGGGIVGMAAIGRITGIAGIANGGGAVDGFLGRIAAAGGSGGLDGDGSGRTPGRAGIGTAARTAVLGGS